MTLKNVEIERKFLVDTTRLPVTLRTSDGKCLVQGYMSAEPAVRVRIADAGTPHAQAWLTIKGKGLVTRSEFEYAIPADDAEQLLTLCAYSLIKTRYKILVGNHTWELDEFMGPHTGLYLAEIELDSEDESFVMPEWVTTEVTLDPRYSNAALAKSECVPA